MQRDINSKFSGMTQIKTDTVKIFKQRWCKQRVGCLQFTSQDVVIKLPPNVKTKNVLNDAN